MKNILLTDNAVDRIKKVCNNAMIRLAIKGGGCSGFQYVFSFVEDIDKFDIEIEKDDAKLILDGMTASMLQGSQVDWVEELSGSIFVISNPNATSSCGCGESFSA